MMRCDWHPDLDAVSILREEEGDGSTATLHLCEWCTDHDDPSTEYLPASLDERDRPPAFAQDRLFTPPATMAGQLNLGGIE